MNYESEDKMKILKKIINYIAMTCLVLTFFLVIGSVGAFEQDMIGTSQLIIQLLVIAAFGLVSLLVSSITAA